MKIRLRLILFIALLQVSANSFANIIRFHSGYIYAAELSSANKDIKKIDILIPENERLKQYQSFNEYRPLTTIPDKQKMLAVVYVKLDKGASLTPYDYTLKTWTGEYRCLSVAPNDTAFKPISYSKVSNLVISSSETVYVRMLFMIPVWEKQRKNKEIFPLKLSYKLSKPSIDQRVNFNNRKDSPFPIWDDLIGGTYSQDSK